MNEKQIQDEYGGVYSPNGKKLLIGPNIVSYEIKQGAEVIADDAFFSHTNLMNVIIPDTVTSIGENAFHGCHSLNSFTIPRSITYIRAGVFRSCGSLANFIIPNTITHIGFCSFASCCGLKSIIIPASVTSIGKGAFEQCSGLCSIIVSAENPVYDSRNDCNAIIHTSTNTLLFGCKNTIIPEGITSIANNAFCQSKLTEITIPNSVESIERCAFFRCPELTRVTISNSVNHIGQGAFGGCNKLNEIVIPRGSREKFLDLLGSAYDEKLVEA